MRTTEERFRPSSASVYLPSIMAAQRAWRSRGAAGPGATVTREPCRGRTPTLVLGGFVPDSAEQVFLLRRFLLQAGDLFALNYPRESFCVDLLCAQLDDLVAELAARQERPIIFGVSFGAGLLLEWLQRKRRAGESPAIAGVVLVSPVAGVADVADVVARSGSPPLSTL